MKIKGKRIGIFEDIVVIPRGDGNIVFKLKPPQDYTDFDKLRQEPKPPTKQLAGGRIVPYLEDPNYRKELAQYYGLKYDWIYVQTLKETEGLEWEHVKYEDILTYPQWRQELMDAGLSIPEFNFLIGKLDSVNGLDNDKLNAARESFLIAHQQQQD